MDALLARLDDLLALLARPGLVAFTVACSRLDSAIAAVMPAAPQLSAQERQRLGSKLARVGTRLAALERSTDDARAQSKQVLLVSAALYPCARLAVGADITGSHAQQLGSAAVVLLRPVRRAMERAAQQLRDGVPSTDAQGLDVSVMALYMVCDLLIGLDDAADSAFAASHVFTPAVALPWLAASSGLLQQLVEANGISSTARFSGALAAVCCRLLMSRHPAFDGLKAAVAADAALCRQLASVLLRTSLPTAVALIAPAAAAAVPGWQPPDEDFDLGNSWRHFKHAVQAACMTCLDREASRLVEQPAECAALWRLVLAGTEAVPVQRPEGVPEATFSNGVQTFLLLFRNVMRGRVLQADRRPGGSRAAAERGQDCWAVLGLLPKLAAMARVFADSSTSTAAGRHMACMVFADVIRHTGSMGAVASAAQAAQLMAAADAAVGLLPSTQRWWQLRQQGAQPARTDGVTALACACLQLWRACYQPIRDGYSAGAPPGSPAELAAAARAARRLQLSSCRAMRWLASEAAAPAWLRSLSDPFGDLQYLLDTAMGALLTGDVVAQDEGERLGSAANEPASMFRRREAANGAACWQAYETLLPAAYPPETLDSLTACHWCPQLTASLMDDCVAWLLSDASLRALGATAKAAFKRPTDGAFTIAHTTAKHIAMRPPALVALLRCGAVRAMLAMPDGELAMRKQDEVFDLFIAVPVAEEAAGVLHQHWLATQAAAAELHAAQAAATRACVYLGCANLGAGGGPFAGDGEGSKRCGKCRTAWYCGTACSHADWRHGGHKRACAALASARQAERAQQE